MSARVGIAYWFRGLVGLLLLCAGTLWAQAPVILLVSDANLPGEVANNHDDSLVQLLEDAGYEVDTSGMGGAYQEGQAPFLDQAKLDAIDAADLVLVSRRTNSGAYDNDRQFWNEIQKPLLLMSGYLTRGAGDNRWGWHDSGAGNADTTAVGIDIEPGQEDHPFVAEFDQPIVMLDLSNTPVPGTIPKGVFLPNTDVVAGGTVIGRLAGKPVLMEIPADLDLDAVTPATAGPLGITGDIRVFLGAWGYDVDNTVEARPAQFTDFITPELECLLTGVISRMLGYDGAEPCGELSVQLCRPTVSRTIDPNPYAPGAVDVSLEVADTSGNNVVIVETYPEGWTVSDNGGGTESPGSIRFETAADGFINYSVTAPKDLSANFSGTVEATFPGCDPHAGTVRGESRIARENPGDQPVTGAIGQDLGIPFIAGGQEEVSDDPLVVNVFASGADIFGTADEGRLVDFGDFDEFDASAVVADLDATHPWAKAGIMARSNAADPGSPYAFAILSLQNGNSFQYRADLAAGAANANTTGAANAMSELRLMRREGTLVEAFARNPGDARWVKLGEQDLPNLTSLVGLALTSHDNNVLAGARFESINISEEPPVRIQAVTNLECEEDGADVNLTFTPPAGAAEIDIIRGGEVVGNVAGDATSYTEVAPPTGDKSYEVVAYDADGIPGATTGCAVLGCPLDPSSEGTLTEAFIFSNTDTTCEVFNEPGRDYTVVWQQDGIPLSLAYDAGIGFGFEVLYSSADFTLFPELPPPIHSARGGWEIYGAMDESPNGRNRFPDECPEEIYDAFIGAKNFVANPCDENIVVPPDPNAPCTDGGFLPDGIIFRVDVPNGDYRFVAAIGSADNQHTHRVLAEDGGEGPPDTLGNHVVLVHNHDQAQFDTGDTTGDPGDGVYARVGFDGRLPPPGDGVAPSPVFVNMDVDGMATQECPESPTLTVTDGYIRFHLLQANSNDGPGGNRDANGGDAVALEIWNVSGGGGVGPFVRGDCNDDNATNITDGVFLLNFLFLGGPPPQCRAACDMNGDGQLPATPTDALVFFNWQFLGGPTPPAPVGACAQSSRLEDATVGCVSFQNCP